VADTGHVAVLCGGTMIGPLVGDVALGAVVGELATAGRFVELAMRPAISAPAMADRAKMVRAPPSRGVHLRGKDLALYAVARYSSHRAAMRPG
jgi:hypothetical protein